MEIKGSLRIGVASTAAGLEVKKTFATPSNSAAVSADCRFVPTGNSAGYLYGLQSIANYEGQYNLTRDFEAVGTYVVSALVGYYGGTNAIKSGGSPTVTSVTGIAAQNLIRSGMIVTKAVGVHIQPAFSDSGGGTVGTVYGILIKSTGNLTPTTLYGLYTEDFGATQFGIYISGTSKSYFGGKVGIGSASPTSPLQVVGLTNYANNAAAVAGGLTAGAFYRNNADPDVVCVVH